MKSVINILVIALVMSACKVGKDYTRADLDVPQTFREEFPLTSDSIVLDWRSFFSEPLLTDLIEKALEKNNEVGVAVLNLRQAEATYRRSKLQLLPSVDLTAGANRTWLSKNSLNGSLSEQFIGKPYLDDYNSGLSLAWEADIWGKAKMQKEEALASFFVQENNLTALRTRIISEVAQAYYHLISLDEQLKIAEQNVELSDSTLQMITLQYHSAQVSSLAMDQAEAQKKTAELLIPLAKQNIAIQENALSILCGEYPGKIARAVSLDAAMPKPVFGAGVPATLLSRRPDVKAAEYAVMAANSRAGLTRANMYPAFSLSASVATNSFTFSNWFALPGSLVKNLGLNLTQPVFRKNELKTAYEIALLEHDKTVKQFRQSVMVAVGEVSDALATLKFTEERLELVAQRDESLKKATNDAILLYKSAMANYLEVITAQNNALQNQLDAVAIKRDKMIATTQLYRAVGGGDR